jgi:hypothetical protein
MVSQPFEGIERLLTAMTETVGLLRAQGEDHWADWLESDRVRIASGDAYGLDHAKQAFGGMGSINDSFPADEPGIGSRLAEIYAMAAQLNADWETSNRRSLT